MSSTQLIHCHYAFYKGLAGWLDCTYQMVLIQGTLLATQAYYYHFWPQQSRIDASAWLFSQLLPIQRQYSDSINFRNHGKNSFREGSLGKKYVRIWPLQAVLALEYCRFG